MRTEDKPTFIKDVESTAVAGQRVYDLMNGAEWNSDLWDEVSEVFRSLGFPEFDPPDDLDESGALLLARARREREEAQS